MESRVRGPEVGSVQERLRLGKRALMDQEFTPDTWKEMP
jgi:hypothetical protein